MKFTLAHLENDNNYPDAPAKRRRGFEFETYLFDLYEEAKLDIQRPHRTDGEQIDGGVFIDGRWYLVEAKWHANELPASSIYAFKGKIEGKLMGTCGFFISWSGYSSECADALAFGKSLNVLLCDDKDVRRALTDGWTTVFRDKIRRSALYGDIYWTPPIKVQPKPSPATSVSAPAVTAEFFVEGRMDSLLVNEVLERYFPNVKADIYPGHGKIRAAEMAKNLPKAANALRFLVVDADGDGQTELQFAAPAIDLVVAFEPEMEVLYFPDAPNPKEELIAAARENHMRPEKWMLENFEKVLKSSEGQKLISRLNATFNSLII